MDRRLSVLSRHLFSASGPPLEGSPPGVQPSLTAAENSRSKWVDASKEYGRSVKQLQTDGELPSMTVFELGLLLPAERFQNEERLLAMAESTGALAPLELLPGPWQAAETREAKLQLLVRDRQAVREGMHTQLYAHYQQQYGDRWVGAHPRPRPQRTGAAAAAAARARTRVVAPWRGVAWRVASHRIASRGVACTRTCVRARVCTCVASEPMSLLVFMPAGLRPRVHACSSSLSHVRHTQKWLWPTAALITVRPQHC